MRTSASTRASKVGALQPKPGNTGFKPPLGAKRTFLAEAFPSLAGLADIAKEFVDYGSLETIYTQGDPATSVFYLEKGVVKRAVVNEIGKEAVLGISGTGDFLGEGCLTGEVRRICTATTIAPSRILVIDRLAMIRLLHADEPFSHWFIQYLLSSKTRVETELISQILNSSEKRLAHTLQILAECGTPGHPQKVLPNVTQETLAEIIGTTRPRVNFFMNKFRKLGFIKYNDRIHVNNSLNSVLHRD
jgi:CRP/FNR family transcriptional regulator, cyclic AMP receptor protein